MTMNGNGLPDLGALGQRVQVLAPPVSFARRLDENGTFEARRVDTPNGIAGAPQRTDLVDADELVSLIVDAARLMIRDELAAFYVELMKRLAP